MGTHDSGLVWVCPSCGRPPDPMSWRNFVMESSLKVRDRFGDLMRVRRQVHWVLVIGQMPKRLGIVVRCLTVPLDSERATLTLRALYELRLTVPTEPYIRLRCCPPTCRGRRSGDQSPKRRLPWLQRRSTVGMHSIPMGRCLGQGTGKRQLPLSEQSTR